MAQKAVIIDHATSIIKAGFAGESEPAVTIKSPQDHTNWVAVEDAWQKVFTELKVKPSDRKILLTEPPFTDTAHREQKTKIMFESLKTPGLFIANQSVLAMYAAGLKTALAIDIGESVTRVVPVVEGYMFPTAVKTMNFGSKDLQTSVDALFQPSIIGKTDKNLQTLICESISACDDSVHEALYKAIVLCGESNQYNGLEEQLQKEILKVAPANTEVKVVKPNTDHQSWIGGSILACVEGFAGMWITKEEYEKIGAKIVTQKS